MARKQGRVKFIGKKDRFAMSLPVEMGQSRFGPRTHDAGPTTIASKSERSLFAGAARVNPSCEYLAKNIFHFLKMRIGDV